jgi:hypothetical protein
MDEHEEPHRRADGDEDAGRPTRGEPFAERRRLPVELRSTRKEGGERDGEDEGLLPREPLHEREDDGGREQRDRRAVGGGDATLDVAGEHDEPEADEAREHVRDLDHG